MTAPPPAISCACIPGKDPRWWCARAHPAAQVPVVAAAHHQQPQASAGRRPPPLLRHGCSLAVQVSGGRGWGRWWGVARDIVLMCLMLRLQVPCNAHVLLQRCRRHLAPARPPQLLHVDPAAGVAGVRHVQVPRAAAQQQQLKRLASDAAALFRV